MPRSKWYRQCHLERPTKGNECIPPGKCVTVTFLPDQFAEKGRVVDLKMDDDTWDRGWTIMYVGPKRAGDLVEANADGWRQHRKRTDV